MERSEPSLVPQWLKGASSGGVGVAALYSQSSSYHQDESGGDAFTLRQRTQPHGVTSRNSHVDYNDASRLPPSSSDRAYYSALRRGPGSGSSGFSDRSIPDKEIFSRGYNNFGRSTTYRNYDAGVDRSDRDTGRERDWDWDRERDSDRDGRDRSRVLGGFGVSQERERDRTEHSDNSSAIRRSGLGSVSGARYEAEVTASLRRVHSMSSASRFENGEKKAADQGIPPTAPPLDSGSLTSSMQKAAFERNFPSLGAQERGAAISGMQSSLSNLVVSSPRPSWHGSSTHRMDGVRSAASSPGLPTGGNPGSALTSTAPGGSNAEGWSSALAEAPTAVNGTLVSPVITPPASSLSNVSLTGSITNLPKMVEAHAQHPSRVRTPPTHSGEKERLEERALIQSWQLMPMIPKTLGPVPRDKKLVRAVDVVAPPSVKARQATGSSQGLSSSYRPSASRPEALKLCHGTGKISARKVPIKEVVPVLSPSSVNLKFELLPLVNSAVGPFGLRNSGNGAGVLNSASRKQKQILARRALPIPPVLVPVTSDGNAAGIRSKDASLLSGSDERRASIPAQANRVDFFNALRRKAGLSATSNIVDILDIVPPKSNNIVNGDEVENTLLEEGANRNLEDVGEERTVVDLNPSENGDRHENDTTRGSEEPISDVEHFGTEGNKGNAEMEGTTYDQLFEDDITFMISLGWSKARVEETDALTQDEIDAFFRKRNELASNGAAQKRSKKHRHKCLNHAHVGSIGSETLSVTTSDSESEDDRK